MTLGDIAYGSMASLVDATWSIPLDSHPWSQQEEWEGEECMILIGSDTVECDTWMPLDVAQSVMLITEWKKDGYSVQDRWTLRGPELNTTDLVGPWRLLLKRMECSISYGIMIPRIIGRYFFTMSH